MRLEKIKKLAVSLNRINHPQPWKWAKEIVDGVYGNLIEEEKRTGWRLWVEDCYCPSGDSYTQLMGIITPEGKRYKITYDYSLEEVSR